MNLLLGDIWNDVTILCDLGVPHNMSSPFVAITAAPTGSGTKADKSLVCIFEHVNFKATS